LKGAEDRAGCAGTAAFLPTQGSLLVNANLDGVCGSEDATTSKE